MTRPTRLAFYLAPVLAAALVAAAPAAEATPQADPDGDYVGHELPRQGADSPDRVKFSFQVTNHGRRLKDIKVRFNAYCGAPSSVQRVVLPIGTLGVEGRTHTFGTLVDVGAGPGTEDLHYRLNGTLIGTKVRRATFSWSSGTCARAQPETPVFWKAERVSTH